MTKNIYFHDNVMFRLKTSPGLTVSVLVYSFSLQSLVFLSSVGRESCPRSDTLATARLFRSLLWHHVFLYRSKSVMKSVSILKPRCIGSRYIGSTVYN